MHRSGHRDREAPASGVQRALPERCCGTRAPLAEKGTMKMFPREVGALIVVAAALFFFVFGVAVGREAWTMSPDDPFLIRLLFALVLSVPFALVGICLMEYVINGEEGR